VAFRPALVQNGGFAKFRAVITFLGRLAILVAAAGAFLLPAQAQEARPFSAADSADLNFKQFGTLAIQDGGRRKPIDTFARESLIRITGRSVYTDKNGRTWRPNDFVLSALLETHDWREEPMILVSLGALKERLGLPATRRRFSFAQLSGLAALNTLVNEAHALRAVEKSLDRVQNEARAVGERLGLLSHLMEGSAFLIVPSSVKESDAWVVPPEFSRYYSEQQFEPARVQLQAVAKAYTEGDSFHFSRSSKLLGDALRTLSPGIYPPEKQLALEYFSNHLEAFYRALWLYGLAFLLLLVAHFRGRGPILRGAGVAVAVIAIALHATGIVLRCLIGGRPPVTNMYESIIWVSFAVSVFGLIFFLRYRTVVYLLAALPATSLALLLVHQMPIAMPASIDPLVPVLRDNFWLTIHVLTITLSYAAFLLACAFGHILLFQYARNPAGARKDAPMHFWLYRVIQLGVLLLAAGTILGGVWANYSWGRFWGWDPKETWALIALLCYITTLHGRLAGWWTQFGLVVASVICFLAVLMAWYGVNFVLGKGLHSYGFGIGGETYVVSFVALDLLFVGFTIWRYRRSRSVRALEAAVKSETVPA
jgi:cytochrome c-type biogenesis protein CcsB